VTNQPEGYWRLIDPVWDSIDIYSGADVFLKTYGTADRRAAMLFSAHFAQSEICNGGFKQLFRNSTGVLAPEAVLGFQTIGMEETAQIVIAAMKLLGERYLRERDERQTALARVDRGALDALDKQFFLLIEKDNGGFEKAADA
jgi:hypothetical protein